MKQSARKYCSWKNIDKEIERLVRSCPEYAPIKHNPAKVPLHHWDPPKSNWDRVHMDYAGPIDNKQLLIIVDAKSKWVEIEIANAAPTSSTNYDLLEDVFSSHGYTKVLVSDNARIFTSEEMKTYSWTNGIFQTFLAAGHPAMNGLAERTVQTIKRRLKAMTDDPRPFRIVQ